MSKPKVFVSRIIAEKALEKLSAAAGIEVWQDELPPPYEILTEKVRDIEGLLSLLTDRVDAPLMDAAPKLKVISNLAVGYDNIDIPEATKRGIPVGNTPEVLTETTADLAFALLMAAARRIVEADTFTRRGLWKTWGPGLMMGQDIHHATLGIIGLGRIGKEMARRARGFDMKVIYYSRTQAPAVIERELELKRVSTLDKLLAEADFISINVPLNENTHYLIGERELDMMKPTAVLVNTSRGPVIDQKALYNALKSGKVFAAGLDVTEVEPIPQDDPLLTLDNVIILPHIGSGSIATREKMGLMAVDNIIAGLRGEPLPNCVNQEVQQR
ncbi:MAG: D-glycerate dehydrogenase [Dehalococcoidales bacterium]|nr:MAG: D-glycerate dehydrogenase [Dehalococcoidales bacterium]